MKILVIVNFEIYTSCDKVIIGKLNVVYKVAFRIEFSFLDFFLNKWIENFASFF